MKLELEPIPDLIQMPCTAAWLGVENPNGEFIKAAEFVDGISNLSPHSALSKYRKQVMRGLVPLSQPIPIYEKTPHR